MKCANPRILAYLISVHSEGTFGKVFTCSSSLYQTDYPLYLKHVFMLGAFVIVSTSDFYPYMIRRLPTVLHSFYEFFVSLFIFDMVCFAVWYPIAYAVQVTLPLVLNSILELNDCCCFQTFCFKDQWPFTLLLHVIAFIFSYYSLYTVGVISLFKRKGSASCMTSKWLTHLKRIHHGIMCTEVTGIEECERCNKLFKNAKPNKDKYCCN